jgi:DNA replication protein DnaC
MKGMEVMSMNEAIDRLMDKIGESVPHNENEYLGEDGLKHCSICHRATEVILNHPFTGESKKMRCVCDCKTGQQEFQERQKQESIDRQRRICFSETNMISWNFQNDDRRNEKISNAMQNYVKNFTDFKKDGKGLLLHGPVGTGKTYYSACIANALIDEGYRVKMDKFSNIVNKLQGTFDGKDDIIRSLNNYTLLIFDDLGAERKSEYMQEQVFNIIDERYRSGLPFIITTNLPIDEIKKPQEIAYQRIYDRILERCFPVEVTGPSRRRQNVKDTYFDVKEKLGL